MEILVISDAVILAVIALVTAALGYVTQIVLSMRKEQKDLKIMVDGRLTELIKSNEIKDQAIGKAEGKAEQKAESKADVAEQKLESKVEIAAAVPIELKIPNLVVEIKPPPPKEENPSEENKT